MGGKIEPPQYSSPTYDAWQDVIRNMSQLGQNIKISADKLQGELMEKLLTLIKDKHAIKKSYAEKRDRLDNDLIKIMLTELDRKHAHYSKMEKEASIAKKEYDTAVDKGKSQAIETKQDKYKKCTMKLHKAHNDYVLHLTEAMYHQYYYRTLLLPELLGNLNYLQNESADTVREIFLDFMTAVSPCTDATISSHKETVTQIEQLSPFSEYQNFVSMKKSELESEAQIAFDASLLKGEADRLPESMLLLNTLSIQGVEHSCNEFHEDLQTVRETLEIDSNTLQGLHQEIEQITDNLSKLSLLQKKMDYTNMKVKFVENDVLEKKLTELHKLTKTCLDSIGDSQPPPGLDLPALDSISASSEPGKSPGPKGSGFFGRLNFLKPKSVKESKEQRQPLFDTSKDVREHEWYHGAVPRIEANNLLKEDGDFLLRESQNSPGDFVLSVKHDGNNKHFKINTNQVGQYKFEVEAFNTVVELVEAHYTRQQAVTRQSGCIIRRPVLKDKWSLSHSDIELSDKLGHGNFGDVFRATFRPENIYVAVKTCRENVDQRTRDKFLMEARILKGYDHVNIVRLIGVCTDQQPVYIVMELVPGGDLGKYLKQNEHVLSAKQLVKMCSDACAGLGYLEEKKCIHRDVAARNCLVDNDGTVKITDFGMSREEEDGVYSVSGGMKQIPIKWTAPEAMNYGRYTSASDVWSFGVLVWEVFSFGRIPYPGQTNTQARESVERGERMMSPKGCPDRMYNDVMLQCWKHDENSRLRFAELLKTIKSIRV